MLLCCYPSVVGLRYQFHKEEHMSKRLIIFLFAAVLLGAGHHGLAHANLITNGGFETGNFTGWTTNGGAQRVDNNPNAPHSGQFAAQLGFVGGEGLLQQSFATTQGATYTLDYFVINPSGAVAPCCPNDFNVYIGTILNPHLITLFSQTNVPSTQWNSYTEYTFSFVAPAATTVLDFAVRRDPSYFGLDDVSVNPGGHAVPEPSSVLLLLSGVTGLAAWRLKRS